jgi:tetratricopeptide (TPR) repeat protein
VNRTIKTLAGILLLVAALALPQTARAQWVLLDAKSDTLVRHGLDATYNLRYTEADSIFNQLIALHPDHPAGYFLLALVDWWRIIPNMDAEARANRYPRFIESQRFSKTFDEKIDRTIEVCDKRLEENPADIIGLFFKGSALGYRARLVTTRNFNASAVLDWIPAIKNGYEAYKIVLECQRLAPSSSDVLLGSGLYNYLSAYIAEKQPAAKSMMGFLPPGDRKIGIQMLRVAGNRAVYANVEAQYSLLEILSEFENDNAGALEVAKALHEKYPSNPDFYKYLAKNYYRTSDYANADTAWNTILHLVHDRVSGYELPLARQGTYYLGDIRLRTGHFEDAVKLLTESVAISKRIDDDDESSWIVQANLKLGNAYDKLQRRNEAVQQYRKVISMSEYSGSRDKAREFLDKPYQ